MELPSKILYSLKNLKSKKQYSSDMKGGQSPLLNDDMAMSTFSVHWRQFGIVTSENLPCQFVTLISISNIQWHSVIVNDVNALVSIIHIYQFWWWWWWLFGWNLMVFPPSHGKGIRSLMTWLLGNAWLLVLILSIYRWCHFWVGGATFARNLMKLGLVKTLVVSSHSGATQLPLLMRRNTARTILHILHTMMMMVLG